MKIKPQQNNILEITVPDNWFISRFIPSFFIVALTAFLFIWIRSKSIFVPGIQGMIAGSIAGWITGFIGRGDSDKFCTFSQRIWLSLSMMVVYGAVSMVALSILYAGIIDPPLYWLGEIINGFEKEPFLGIGRHKTQSGTLEGGWWIFFNLLDFMLFTFLFLVLSGVGMYPDNSENDEQIPEDSETEDESLPEPEFETVESSRSGFHAFVLTIMLLLASGLGYWYYEYSQESNPYSMENMTKMKAIAGRWELENLDSIFGKSEDSRIIEFSAGFNSLHGNPDNKAFLISLNKYGKRFSGLLYLKNKVTPIPVRAQFSPDGKTVIMVFTVWNIYGRKEVTLTGNKIG